jgi:SAM-dependent methyltransferase
MPDRSHVTLYDATTWYGDSRFYRWIYGDSYRSLFARLARRRWLEESSAPLRVLDCGIGTGPFIHSLIAAFDGRLDLYGVDTSPGMLDCARRRFRRLSTGLYLARTGRDPDRRTRLALPDGLSLSVRDPSTRPTAGHGGTADDLSLRESRAS